MDVSTTTHGGSQVTAKTQAAVVSEAKIRKAKNKTLNMNDVARGAFTVVVAELDESVQRGMDLDVASPAEGDTAAHTDDGAQLRDTAADSVIDAFADAAPAGVKVVNSMWEVTGRESFHTVVSQASNFWVGEKYVHRPDQKCISCGLPIEHGKAIGRPVEVDVKHGGFNGVYGHWHRGCLKSHVRDTNPFYYEELVDINRFGEQVAGLDMRGGFAPHIMRLKSRFAGGDLSDEAFLAMCDKGEDWSTPVSNPLWIPKPVFFAIMDYNLQQSHSASELLASKFHDMTDAQRSEMLRQLPSHMVVSPLDPSIAIDSTTGKWLDRHALGDALSSTTTKMSLIPKVTISPWTVPGYMDMDPSSATPDDGDNADECEADQ